MVGNRTRSVKWSRRLRLLFCWSGNSSFRSDSAKDNPAHNPGRSSTPNTRQSAHFCFLGHSERGTQHYLPISPQLPHACATNASSLTPQTILFFFLVVTRGKDDFPSMVSSTHEISVGQETHPKRECKSCRTWGFRTAHFQRKVDQHHSREALLVRRLSRTLVSCMHSSTVPKTKSEMKMCLLISSRICLSRPTQFASFRCGVPATL